MLFQNLHNQILKKEHGPAPDHSKMKLESVYVYLKLQSGPNGLGTYVGRAYIGPISQWDSFPVSGSKFQASD